MKFKKKYIFGSLGIIVCFALVLGMGMMGSSDNLLNPQSISYRGNVCVTHTNADGEVISSECDHNILFTDGAEAIEQYIGNGTGGSDAFDWIALCDATNATCAEPTAGGAEAYTAYADSGLVSVAGSYASIGNGNWSISNTFTATADDLLANVTRLLNDDDDKLAGNSFTLVTLQTNDQLTINWTIGVA